MSAPWQPGESAPKDGTVIVADGHVFWRDDVSCGTDPFLARVRWEKDSTGFEGWHYAANGMCVASMPEDEVRIHWWVQPPEEKS